MMQYSGPDTPPLSVEDAWARAPAGTGLPVEVFFTVVNHQDVDDSLYEVQAAFAQMEELLTVVTAGAPSTYAVAGPVRIPRQSKVLFRPNGLLVALNMLDDPVLEGDEIELTLFFQNAGSLRIKLPVYGPFSYGE